MTEAELDTLRRLAVKTESLVVAKGVVDALTTEVDRLQTALDALRVYGRALALERDEGRREAGEDLTALLDSLQV